MIIAQPYFFIALEAVQGYKLNILDSNPWAIKKYLELYSRIFTTPCTRCTGVHLAREFWGMLPHKILNNWTQNLAFWVVSGV
jgi:hypothetical protein